MADTDVNLEFDKARKKFKDSLHASMSKNEVEILFKFVDSYKDERIEKRTVLDQVFRDVLCQMIGEAKENDILKEIVNFAVESVKNDMCSPSTPFMMLADVFDMMTLERCEDIFDLVEDKVSIWKSDPFYESGKNYLLRMCNDLIRRLSKSQNTVFCGRIQLFLSRLFPLSEKSALNLASQFNLDNVTIYANQKDPNEAGETSEPMEVEKGEEKNSTIPIDYHLYSKFWALQDYFRRPIQCYEKGPWETFIQHARDVMAIFSSYKLDDLSSSRKKTPHTSQVASHATHQQQMENFFAKYLTSEKLLNLQLSDSNFRRYVLVQFLIIFQYLKNPVKFKNQNQVLSEDQSDWIKESKETVLQLLSETPPHGEQFCNSVKHILEREEHWNTWKNESCPSYIKERQKESTKQKSKPKRRRIGDDLMATGGKVTKMGNSELTRLWNLSPDNMEACKADSRVFLPKLDDFFANSIEQADPEAMVEEQYKDINQQNFQWKAYRLLARSSPHFFVHTNTPGQPLAIHLKDIVDKMMKEKHPNMSMSEIKQEVSVAEEEDEMKDNNDDEDELGQEDQEENGTSSLQLTKDHVRIVSAQLGSNWMKLGSQLGVPKDDMDYFKGQFESNTEAAVSMLTVWQEEDPERDCVSTIKTALKAINLEAIIDILS